jgi:hypothetical protein
MYAALQVNIEGMLVKIEKYFSQKFLENTYSRFCYNAIVAFL